MNQSRTTIYGGHMHKTNKKKKTRYTDDEINKIKQEAYDRGRAGHIDILTGADEPSYAQGVADGRAQALDKAATAMDQLDGRAGKRKAMDTLEEVRNALLDED